MKRMPKIMMGKDSIDKTFDLLKGKFKKVLIVANERVQRSGVVERIMKYFPDAKLFLFGDIMPNPVLEVVDQGAKLARDEGCDLVVAIGGGSVMDTAKCIAALTVNDGEIRQYFDEGKEFDKKGVMTVCIPTTSGTASEVTGVSVFTEGTVKKTLSHLNLYADYAIIEPSLTYTMPPHIVAETGWDAFCHALESYWSINANPITKALAMQGIRLAWENIEMAFKKDEAALDNMAYASLAAGMAFSQTRTSVLHAISYDLTAWYGLAHGRACAINLVPFAKFCYPAFKEDMDRLFALIGIKNIDEFLSEMQRRLTATGIATKLSDVNVPYEDLQALAESTDKRVTTHYLHREIDSQKLLEILKTYY